MTARPLLSALALLLLAGCAALPTVEQLQPLSADLSRYRAVQVSVDGTERIRQTAGFEATSTALRDEFTAILRASGRFSEVGPEVQSAGVLLVKLTITDLNYVHGTTRGFVGILGGRAVLDVTMALADKASGAALGEVRAAHSSSHAQGVFSPVTSTQVTAIAKEFSLKLSGK